MPLLLVSDNGSRIDQHHARHTFAYRELVRRSDARHAGARDDDLHRAHPLFEEDVELVARLGEQVCARFIGHLAEPVHVATIRPPGFPYGRR